MHTALLSCSLSHSPPAPWNSIQLFLSFIPKLFVQFDLHQPCQTRSRCGILAASSIPCPSHADRGAWTCRALVGVSVSIQRPMAAVTSAGQIPALRILAPNGINSVSEGAYTEISCSQRGLSAPCLWVVRTGGELC